MHERTHAHMKESRLMCRHLNKPQRQTLHQQQLDLFFLHTHTHTETHQYINTSGSRRRRPWLADFLASKDTPQLEERASRQIPSFAGRPQGTDRLDLIKSEETILKNRTQGKSCGQEMRKVMYKEILRPFMLQDTTDKDSYSNLQKQDHQHQGKIACRHR